ncbi:dynactin subunit 3-like isoform X1 [Biomphalaria pfeifferi]|uniref:Dynactin subunit 3-like isoform X1 n=1 Tax=Biomphalaria pfeifferi TaxID=112525 RepID=A0AAD8BD19_BIOPF|nr:dynactin subunit 3-like isoform X1 [Biomphalaria pfeifferi]
MAGEESLQVLEKRIADLELLVFGNSEKDADYPKNKANKIQCLESLLEIQNKITTSLSGKKKAAALYEKLPELKKYLDHSYVEELLLTEDARLESLLAEYDFLEKQCGLWQKLSENEININSEHIQAVPKLVDKLQTLSLAQISQQDDISNLTEETRRLLNTYNTIITLFSKQFVMWDETLTQLELQAQQKKMAN